MNCETVQKSLSDHLVGETDDPSIESHLVDCPDCRRAASEGRQVLAMVGALGRGAPSALSPERRAALLARPDRNHPSPPARPAARGGNSALWISGVAAAGLAALVGIRMFGSTQRTKFDGSRDMVDAQLDTGPSRDRSPAMNRGGRARPFDAGRPAPEPPAMPDPRPEPEPTIEASHAGHNPTVDTSTNNLSTFALDVDTGSYTLARNHLQAGHLPPPATVRTEEFVNYFDYGYADPAEGDGPFAIHVEGAPSRFGDRDQFLLRIGIQARRVPAEERPTAQLTFVVDVSGSMREEGRLVMVQQALRTLVEHLRGDDRVALVAYSNTAQVVLAPTGLVAKSDILAAIGRLRPQGGTNVEAGLDLGYQVAIENFAPGAINRVVFLSDGMANIGATGPGGLLARIQDRVDDGITLTTVGVGRGAYNDRLMETLADTGDGTYHYVDRLDEAERVFAANLGATLQTIAREAKAQVEFDADVVADFRLLGYENRRLAASQFRDDSVDAGEIGAGHSATALYRIRFRDVRAGAAATIRLRWTDPDTGRVTEIERTIDRRDFHAEFGSASPSTRLAASVAEFADVLRGGPEASPENLDVVADQVRGLARDFDEVRDVVELAGFVETARRLIR